VQSEDLVAGCEDVLRVKLLLGFAE
jgi:hypothetical protein